MMHQPSGGIGGTAADIAIQAEQMLYTKRMFQERVSFHTGQSLEQIEADSDRDRWFTAEEAKDYGFIDKVITGATQVSGRRRHPRPEERNDDDRPELPPGLREVHNRYILPSYVERTSYGIKEIQPVQQAVRGAHHLPRRADRRRVGQRRDGAAADAGVAPTRTATSSCTSTRPAARSPRMTAIYDTMQYVRPDIQTVCLGQAASAAAVLLAAGTPGKRLALPNSRIIIHQPATEGGYGQGSDIEIQAREILRMRTHARGR